MGRCRRHPHHIVVGVCAYCLNEQLSDLLEGEEEDGTEYCSCNGTTHLHTQHNLHSPFAPTSSNPSTRCGTVPDTPLAAPHRTPPRLPDYNVPGMDDLSPKASSHQCFSLSFSPQNQVRSDSYTPSYVCSPQNQVFLGNHDFIKGEIPRKTKNSFWSFLNRHKPGFYNSCGTAYLRRNFVLDQESTYDHMCDEQLQQQLQNNVHKDVHRRLRDMHLYGEKHGFKRHGLSKTTSPSMFIGSFDRDITGLHQVSQPPCLVPPNHYQKYPYLSKPRYSHFNSSGHKTIGLSPLRHEKHGDENEVFSQRLQHVYAAHGIDKYGNAKRSHCGLSSSWGSSIFPWKMRRSKSISGLSEISDFGPMVQATSRSSSDITAPKAKSVSLADEEMNNSPKCIPEKVPQDSLIKKACNRSPNNYVQDTYVGQRKSLTGTSSYGLHSNATPSPGSYKNNHSQNLKAFPQKNDAHARHKSLHLSQRASSLLSRSGPQSVSIECRKATRVSPLILTADKKGSSPYGPFHGTHDRFASPQYRNRASQNNDDDGNFNGTLHGYMPPYEGLDESSTLPSDDESWRSPSLFDPNLAKFQMHSKSPCKKISEGHNSRGQQIKEPAFGSHVFAYSTTRSWSKALGNMLRIRRGGKQSIKVQAVSSDAQNHHVQHDMDKMHKMRMHNLHHQSHQNADHSDVDDSDFIDYEQSDLYDDYYSHRDIPLVSHEYMKAHELQAKESQVFPGLQDQIKGPPQQYSFLSRDYSAYSCYFSPPSHAFHKAEMARGHISSHKQMQMGNGAVGMSKKSNLLSSTLGGMRGSIASRSRRG